MSVMQYKYNFSVLCKKIITYRIKKLEIDQILESRITIDTFLKAIINFDNTLINLNKENLINYCLMKDK